MEYLFPVLIFLALGLISAILLTVASKIFAVKVDERIEKIQSELPQANCGACGFAGCADYADAIVTKGASTTLCKPGGVQTCEKIALIMGQSADIFVAECAFVHCNGSCENTKRCFDYEGISTCAAAKKYYGGFSSCTYGCLGLGDCANVCANNAITIADGVAAVDKSICTACGKCVEACPNHLISLMPLLKIYSVKCSSHSDGKATKAACKKGCIGCKICQRKCMSGAITVENNCAQIDYSKCINCGQCFEACPTGAIFSCEKQKMIH